MFNIGDKVKKITDGNVGTVKNILSLSDCSKYQVLFENGEMPYLSEDMLQPFVETKSPIEAFSSMEFNGIDDFRRVLAFQRLNGELTNMFYSMTDGIAKFYAHQFLPVTKFLQSPEERLLIADEVGLGKTVEAIYIWKELEARRNAKKLLVVCPAALREKWLHDMKNLFEINAEIVKADTLLKKLKDVEINPQKEQFCYVCSIESIRSKKSEIIPLDSISTLNNAFEEFSANHSEYAFDLTIIDEAHYLRNRETANFKTGERLRDISESLLLLSATPIQTGSENLYSIMNLLAPERFEDPATFDYMLKRDGVLIKIANCLQRTNSTFEEFDELIKYECEQNNVLNNTLIDEIISDKENIFLSKEKRLSYAAELRDQVFYSNLFNRTRRRFVFINTAKRKPVAVKFTLSLLERNIYDRVTKLVREMSYGKTEIMTFALISRQRQMASCLPAAIEDWKNKINEQFENINDAETSDVSEFETENESDLNAKKIYRDLKPFYFAISEEFKDIDINELKKNDSKYSKFLSSIKELLKINPQEKIIVFSFFRGTNEYLEKRLTEDNINVVAIKGGMGQLKEDLLEQFKNNKNINVLISSEVGSEGLDLQFASVEYNYDLPWNPMRLEQRIGRIDRIGQIASVLRIFNLYCEDTIEDKILEKLYERVKIFETSIGDMEDIVGQPIQELALEILNPNLTDKDRDEKAEQKIQVLINQRIMNNKLEDESGLLDEYRELVVNSVQKAKTNKRCIEAPERMFIVKDFLKNYYPGTSFYENKDLPGIYMIKLSEDALFDFREFRRNEHINKLTSLDSGALREIYVSFSKIENSEKKIKYEIMDLDHPVFDWIKWTIKRKPIKALGCSALSVNEFNDLKKGNYIFYIQKWKKSSIEKSVELKYFLISMENSKIYDSDKSEYLLNSVFEQGTSLINADIKLRNFEPFYESMQKVVNYAWDQFELNVENYKKKSFYLYNKQTEFVNFTADRKIKTLSEMIEKMKIENRKPGVIHMNEKRLEKINLERNMKLKLLEKNKFIEPELYDIAIGVLIVE